MSRILRKAILPAALLSALAALPASAHEGDPHYSSVVSSIVPRTDGLSAQVLDHDDALLVVNASGRDVTILDLKGEPYARLQADGTVQVNARSSLAVGENAPSGPHGQGGDRADARLSASVTPLLAHAGHAHGAEAPAPAGGGGAASAGPDWVTVDRAGRYQWHDPRINYRARPVPPQVTDTAKETKVKDWRVPLLVAGQAGDVLGTLTWVGEPGGGSSFPTAAVASLALLVLLALGAVALVQRRRRTERAGTS
ncbi:MAG: hypothetical protein JSS99_12055 [Actinobacteria bacterium]|nr:hypothetical protein [Actinomycetota bacterium]